MFSIDRDYNSLHDEQMMKKTFELVVYINMLCRLMHF